MNFVIILLSVLQSWLVFSEDCSLTSKTCGTGERCVQFSNMGYFLSPLGGTNESINFRTYFCDNAAFCDYIGLGDGNCVEIPVSGFLLPVLKIYSNCFFVFFLLFFLLEFIHTLLIVYLCVFVCV